MKDDLVLATSTPGYRPSLEHSDALRLTCVEEKNGVVIHQIHFFQIQSYFWITTLDLGFHLVNVLNSESQAQPNPRSPLAKICSIFSVIEFLVPKRTLTNAPAGPFVNSLRDAT